MNISQLYLLARATIALLKMNCQITPSTTPPIRFGTKKNVRKIFLLRRFDVTSKANPNATTFTMTSDTSTKSVVKRSVLQKVGSLKDFM